MRSTDKPKARKAPQEIEQTASEPIAFDPLGWPGDTVPVIAAPPDTSIVAKAVSRSVAATGSADSVLHRIYRVQLLTTETYGDGRQALRVAEEIFDQPVFLDYDTPNYKVRIGNFVKRIQAEEYLRRAQSAGYPNAWVVAITVPLPGLKPGYDSLPGPLADTARGDTASAGNGQ